MANQLAIVTGASSDIGPSLSKELAWRGYGLDVVPRRSFMRRETQRTSSACSKPEMASTIRPDSPAQEDGKPLRQK